MGRGYRAEQFGADKVHQLAFTLGKAGEALFYKFGCGKDGVVVRYLFAVQYPAHFRSQRKSLGKGQQPQQIRHKMLYRLAHVLGQILAVRAGIGQQFLFIKLLGIVKGLLCREAEQAVCLPLQGSQVIKFGRLFRLFSHRMDTQTAFAPVHFSLSKFAASASAMRPLSAFRLPEWMPTV